MPLEYRSPAPPRRPLAGGERVLRAVAVTLFIGGLSCGVLSTAVLVLALSAVWPFSYYQFISFDARLSAMPPVILAAAAGYSIALIGNLLDPSRGQNDEDD